MRILIIITLLLASFVASNAQEWQKDLNKSKEIAKENNQNILLLFSGSDWCTPCIKLEKNIWDSAEFEKYAQENLVLLKVDFPKKRKNKLPKEQQKKNDKLFEKYNTLGAVPFVVILDKAGKILGTTGYKDISPKEYIENINSFIPKKESAQKVFHRKLKLMGSRFDITVSAITQEEADVYIDMAVEEISRIEKLISSWDKTSQTSAINQKAGIELVKTDTELFDLIKRSLAISELTDGAFDISYASMDRIWKFDGSMKEFPTEEEIRSSVAKVNYQNIILDEKEHTVFLKLKGMKIGFGGIGKGYAADKAKELLISEGVVAGIINASGDMNTWGKQPNGEDWTIAITNPLNKDKEYALLPILNGAVVTSGDYEKFVIFNDKKYSHIIDPRTGYPASGIISVTVFAASAELADALATSIFVMGTDVGLDRINQLPNIDCIIIDETGNIHKSKNIRIKN
ncbi:MAG: FAD:protein FMN transferase [Candidatus Tenebribacter mawsonii]|nr:FAD:protein FMN transferase [Candidatus Tenebribacter mawsonii]